MTKYKGIASTEAEQQKQLIAWCNTMSLYKGYEDLALIYHCPNGGSRNKLEAMNLKCEGVKPVCLIYFYLWLEVAFLGCT